MKLPQVNLWDLIRERIEFIPRCPESRDLCYISTPMNRNFRCTPTPKDRDLHYVPTSNGKFKFK